MNQGGNDMYQANDGKWYPKQAMPQGWQQGSNGGYTGPNGAGQQQQQYGGAQQGNYWGAAPHMYANQPMYVRQGRAGGGAGAAAGGGILGEQAVGDTTGLCCGALLC